MKLLEEMTDEELLAEIERLNKIPVPSERKPGQPPKGRKPKAAPKAKASWKDALDMD